MSKHLRPAPWRKLFVRLGFKPYLFHCPRRSHNWRQVYGDERMQLGAVYLCRNCPAKTDMPKIGMP